MTVSLAFLAGLLAILSPCVLPLAPVVVAGARARDPRGPLALAFGFALTFGLAGGLAASAGASFGEGARRAGALALVAAGVMMLVPALREGAASRMSAVARWAGPVSCRLPASGLIGFAAAGVALAFAWAPCVGPTLGAAFALAAGGGSVAMAMTTMACYALGAALALLAAGYGLGLLASRSRALTARAARFGQTAFAAVLILVGAVVLTGADRDVEAAALAVSPQWLITLTTRF